MAIFQFIKGAGDLVSSGLTAATEAAKAYQAPTVEAIEAKIKASGIVHKDLALKLLDPSSVKIYAVVEEANAKADLVLLVGNTHGVEKVEDAIKVRPPGSEQDVVPPAPRFYRVKSGDTLSSIAKSELGSEDRYTEIFKVNRGFLKNPDQIDVGQTLRIPN